MPSASALFKRAAVWWPTGSDSVAVAVIVCAALAIGHSSAQAADEPPAELAQRQRIAQEREQVQAHYSNRAAQCHQVFAVNECLAQANRVRREALADLRRQELSLNSAQAKRDASDQVLVIEKKSSVETLSQRDADRLAANAQALQRQQGMDEKREQQATKASQAQQHQDDARQRLQQKGQAQSEAKAKLEAAPDERKRYEEKLQAAQQRQVEREKRLSEQKPSPPRP